jgi:glycosyltransferase involved in cell wall biosynthesis
MNASVGLVAPGRSDYWLGGFHYVQHLVEAVSRLPATDRVPVREVWWGEGPDQDYFPDLRGHLGPPLVLGLPRTPWGRLVRAWRGLIRPSSRGTLADIFERAGIHALFPVPPCDALGIPFIFWISDLQYRHHPEFYPAETAAWFETYNRRHAPSAARILVMSQSVLDDVRRFFPEWVSKTRVVRVPSVPTNEWWATTPVEASALYRLPPRYFVISNQVAAHKNHRTIIEAMRILRDRGVAVPLMCTGRTEDYRDPSFFPALCEDLARDGMDAQVRFLGVVPRPHHIAILRGAVCVLQPSIFEGWGLAVADAKALARPILASDIAAHREQQHPDARYLPICEPEAWATAMAEALREARPGTDEAAEREAAAEAFRTSEEGARAAVELFREVLR